MRSFWKVAFAGVGMAIPLLYVADMRRAYQRLEGHNIKTLKSEFGKMSYIDEGQGEAILVSHGLFGGFDQGHFILKKLVGDSYRKISLSRFGYPGSKLPAAPTPQNQARVYAELLDELGIEKAYVLAASIGGASALAFALAYPERLKGLILASADVPSCKMSSDQLKVSGPPAPLKLDLPLWLSTRTAGSVKPRRKGIETDANITIPDMDLNFDQYPIKKITAPIFVIHAKDDPMALYDNTEKFISCTEPDTLLFEEGGHLMSGHHREISQAIQAFIRKTS
jgi:pimeloyl-ACP methyl ester carboxylesterase